MKFFCLFGFLRNEARNLVSHMCSSGALSCHTSRNLIMFHFLAESRKNCLVAALAFNSHYNNRPLVSSFNDSHLPWHRSVNPSQYFFPNNAKAKAFGELYAIQESLRMRLLAELQECCRTGVHNLGSLL